MLEKWPDKGKSELLGSSSVEEALLVFMESKLNKTSCAAWQQSDQQSLYGQKDSLQSDTRGWGDWDVSEGSQSQYFHG